MNSSISLRELFQRFAIWLYSKTVNDLGTVDAEVISGIGKMTIRVNTEDWGRFYYAIKYGAAMKGLNVRWHWFEEG